jgi:hypothetical protein
LKESSAGTAVPISDTLWDGCSLRWMTSVALLAPSLPGAKTTQTLQWAPVSSQPQLLPVTLKAAESVPSTLTWSLKLVSGPTFSTSTVTVCDSLPVVVLPKSTGAGEKLSAEPAGGSSSARADAGRSARTMRTRRKLSLGMRRHRPFRRRA